MTSHRDHTDPWFDAQTGIITFDSVRLADIDRLAMLMLLHLPTGIVLGLVGTLGAGKTRLVQAIAKAAQIDDADVTSPTFTLLQTYRGSIILHHLDAYRIQDEDEFLQLGVEELFDDGDAWTLVEWADRVRSTMPIKTVWIRILIAPNPTNVSSSSLASAKTSTIASCVSGTHFMRATRKATRVVIDPHLPAPIARVIQATYEIVSVVPIEPGMSGASVFRCESRDGQRYALKRWPKPCRRSRIDEVHRVISRSRDAGCQLLPRLHPISGDDTVLSADGCWELSDWMPGQVAKRDATLELAEAGAAAIASFHRAAATLGSKVQMPPAVHARLKRVNELESLLPMALRASPADHFSPRLAAAIDDAQSLLTKRWCFAVDQICYLMRQYADRPTLTQYVLRDVHRDHVLFDSDQATGLIDFDAVRIDVPATDLARWAGSLMIGRSDAAALWDAVLAGFRRESPSINQQNDRDLIRLAKDLHFATKWVSLANWIVWLQVDQRRFPAGEDVVAERILEWTQLSAQEA